MAVPTTPEEWLPVLAKRLDDRYPTISRARRYATGKADLPEAGKNVRKSWEAFQRKARTDYGGIAVRSLLNRIKPTGVRIGDSDDHPALTAARRIWRDNRVVVQLRDAIRDAEQTGVGYVVVGVDTFGFAVVTRERPEQFIALTDPLRPWRARATLKVWRDDVVGRDFALVTAPGVRQRFVRDSVNEYGSKRVGAVGGWTPDGDPVEFDGDPTVAIFEREEGEPFLAPHFDVIDRINTGKLQRLVTTAMQAFRQRAIKPKDKDGAGLPEFDADGNAIDWAKVLEPAPGAMWDLPVAIDIWESQPTDIRPLLDGEKKDAQDFAAATGTPISVLIPDGQNQSATGADAAQAQQVEQAENDIALFKPAAAAVMLYALRAEGADLGDDTVEVLFAPAAYVSVTERFAAAVQAKGAGLSSKTIKRDILGMTPEQIRQDEADVASDQLAAALLAFGAPETETPGGGDAGAA